MGGEEDDRGWDGWMASPTQWTWVWANSGSWWWTRRPGVLQSMGFQRIRHNWVTELNWGERALTASARWKLQYFITSSQRIWLQCRRPWVGKILWRRDRLHKPVFLGFPGGLAGKESACNVGDLGSIPGLGRFPWRRERLPTPLFWPGEFHGLFHGITKSWTWLSDFHFTIKGHPGNPVKGKRIGKDNLY